MVTLRGTVLHPSDRRVVDAAAWSVGGVIDVRDELITIEDEPTLR